MLVLIEFKVQVGIEQKQFCTSTRGRRIHTEKLILWRSAVAVSVPWNAGRTGEDSAL